MLDSRYLQLYLMSFMRGHQMVEQARRRLGADAAEMALARTAVLSSEIGRPGHAMAAYASILGAPIEEERVPSAEQYRSLVRRYRLAVWPDLDLAVYGDESEVTGSVAFVRRKDDSSFLPALVPWGMVEEDLVLGDWRTTVIEEWYPAKDVRCEGGETEGSETHLLCFDFGLLQIVSHA